MVTTPPADSGGRIFAAQSPDDSRLRECPDCGQRRLNARPIWIRDCAECGKTFVANRESRVFCGRECSLRNRNRSNARTRWKRSVRRSVERLTDITPEQEDELRRRTRKCTLCGAWMTSRPHKPNSKELDHIVPINQGGTHTHGNVRIICRSCNMKRPKDGSDYTGPITLWATTLGFVTRPEPEPKSKRKPELRQWPTMLCSCGRTYPLRPGPRTPSRCHDCLVELGRAAAALRRNGWKWREITDKLGYSNIGSLHSLAQRYGSPSEQERVRA